MKKTRLTWFDRLMVGITFAEAGVEKPHQRVCGCKTDECGISCRRKELFEPCQDNPVPTFS